VLYGSVADGPWYVQLIREKTDVSSFRDQIVFGRSFAERTSSTPQRVDTVIKADRDTIAADAGLQCQTA
jgi:nitrite reductase (NADH) large subunit